jgi:hypothetical protein
MFKFTLRVKTCFAFNTLTEESATWTLKVKAPVAAVVPVMAPLELRLSPTGSAPQEIFQL